MQEHTWAQTHARTHTRTSTEHYRNTCAQAGTLSRPDIKKNATREDLNFHMDRSFILKRNKRQICHPTEHCVCSLNVRVKIPPYFEEDRALISQLTLLQPSFSTWLGHGNRLNKHCMFAQHQVKRLSITSLHLSPALPLRPSAGRGWLILSSCRPSCREVLLVR